MRLSFCSFAFSLAAIWNNNKVNAQSPSAPTSMTVTLTPTNGPRAPSTDRKDDPPLHDRNPVAVPVASSNVPAPVVPTAVDVVGGGGGGNNKKPTSPTKPRIPSRPNERGPTKPTVLPTLPPSLQPSLPPTLPPSLPPTRPPTLSPTLPPSLQPTLPPSLPPTLFPTKPPTSSPTLLPTKQPTLPPTLFPTKIPTSQPTEVQCDTAYPCFQALLKNLGKGTTSFQGTICSSTPAESLPTCGAAPVRTNGIWFTLAFPPLTGCSVTGTTTTSVPGVTIQLYVYQFGCSNLSCVGGGGTTLSWGGSTSFTNIFIAPSSFPVAAIDYMLTIVCS